MPARPFIGDIMMFGGNFAPQGWAFCDGSLINISGNETLFTLIGTTYGGDGVNTFQLPDLRSRVPINQGSGPGLSPYVQGQTGGVESVTLIGQQLPVHTHVPSANAATGTQSSPAGNFWAAGTGTPYSDQTGTLKPMNTATVSAAGGSQPHDNMLPYQAITFVIALEGIFPSQN